jgi:hypothetical protein
VLQLLYEEGVVDAVGPLKLNTVNFVRMFSANLAGESERVEANGGIPIQVRELQFPRPCCACDRVPAPLLHPDLEFTNDSMIIRGIACCNRPLHQHAHQGPAS